MIQALIWARKNSRLRAGIFFCSEELLPARLLRKRVTRHEGSHLTRPFSYQVQLIFGLAGV